MATKKNFRVRLDAPVTAFFCIASLLIFVLDKFALKNFNLAGAVFSAPGARGSEFPFNFSSPAHYARLVLYVFGNTSFLQFLISSAFILPLGAMMEERYGRPAVAIMMVVAAFVSGVLNACLVPRALCGAGSIALMLIFLSSITSIAKNEIPLSSILILLCCVACLLYISFFQAPPALTESPAFKVEKFSVVALLVQVAGSLSASMAGFLTAPKAKRASSSTTQKSFSDRQARLEEIDRESPRKNSRVDEETTVIGSINI